MLVIIYKPLERREDYIEKGIWMRKEKSHRKDTEGGREKRKEASNFCLLTMEFR